MLGFSTTLPTRCLASGVRRWNGISRIAFSLADRLVVALSTVEAAGLFIEHASNTIAANAQPAVRVAGGVYAKSDR
jgi:hypothetical protein